MKVMQIQDEWGPENINSPSVLTRNQVWARS